MIANRLRAILQFGILVLVLLAPLPFGSVQAQFVLTIELTAVVLGLAAILLILLDDAAVMAVPRTPLAVCAGLIGLGILQIIPIPFSIAERFNPTAELVRPLIPYLGLGHPPPVSWSVATPETTDALLRFIAYVLIGVTAAIAFDTDNSRRRFAFVLVAVAVFQAAYGAGEYITGRQHVFGFAKIYYLDSATGTFINRNHFATLLAVALPFSLALSIPEKRRPYRTNQTWREQTLATLDGRGLDRVLAIGASAVIWMGLLLSHSRGGLLAALVAAGIVLFQFRGTRAARWTGAIGLGVLLLLLSAELSQTPGERFLELKNELNAKAGRAVVWGDALRLVASRPLLGRGYGTFDSDFPLVQSADIDVHYDHAHNDWLEWATEGGILVLGIALALFGFAMRESWRKIRTTGGSATLVVACQAALAALAVHAAWDFSLRIPAVAIIAATLMGLALTRSPRSFPHRGAAKVFPASLDHAALGHQSDTSAPPETGGGRRRLVGLACAVLLILAAGSAIATFRNERHPTVLPPDVSAHVWLGPKGHTVDGVIDERLKNAIGALGDPKQEALDRIPAYQSKLETTQNLLRRAILADPSDAHALLRLAAVKWELGVLQGATDGQGVATLVDVAGACAPSVPEVQADLGEILYGMGHSADANRFIANAVQLSPVISTRAVRIMVAAGLDPLDILRTLPPTPDVLIALTWEFAARGRGVEALPIFEARLSADASRLLESYGSLALALGQSERLSSRLTDLGHQNDVHVEAERQLQLGRAASASGVQDAAYRFGMGALTLWPADPRYCEFAATAAVDSHHFSEAEGILRDGITRLAATEGAGVWRARFYRRLGEIYEQNGKGDEAIAYYRHALEQDPKEPIALARIARVESLLNPKDRNP